MTELSPEEKQRIYDEEKTRLEAQEKIKKESEAKKTKTGCLGLIGLIVFIVVMMWVCGVFTTEKESTTPPEVKPQPKSESLEFKLATIEKGYVSRDDIIIARFRSLLEQLDAKFIENKTQISDMSVGAQKLLREEEGIKESLLNIMEGMNRLFSSESANLKYSEYASAYMVLRTKGQSHHEAVEGLKALLQSLGIY